MDLPKEHEMVRCVREGLEGPSKAKANITSEECLGKHLGECTMVLSCFSRNQMFTCGGDATDIYRHLQTIPEDILKSLGYLRSQETDQMKMSVCRQHS